MKVTLIWLWMAVLVLSGCSRHMINYEIGDFTDKFENNKFIIIDTFRDERPIEEREGHSGKFLAFASKDDDFTEPSQISITNLLKEELRNSGFKLMDEKSMKRTSQACMQDSQEAVYHISGEILHFQTMVKLPGTTIIPYLGTVATLWESDEFTTIVTIRARMENTVTKGILFEREFNISENLRLKTGILNLERWFGRGMGYQFKLLDMALADVLGQIRDEVIRVAIIKG